MADFRVRLAACTKCADQTPLDVAELLEHSGQVHYNLHLFKCTGCDKTFSTAFYASLHPCSGEKRVYLVANLASNDVMCQLVAMQNGLNDSLRNCIKQGVAKSKAPVEKELKNDSPPVEEKPPVVESPASPEVTKNYVDDEEEDPYADEAEAGTSSSSVQPMTQENGVKQHEAQQEASSNDGLPQAEVRKNGGYSSAEEGEIVDDDDEEADNWVLENYGNRGDDASKKRSSTVGGEAPPSKKPCPDFTIETIDRKNIRQLRALLNNGSLEQGQMLKILDKIQSLKTPKTLDGPQKAPAGEKKEEAVPTPPENNDVHMEDLEEVDEVGGEDDDGTQVDEVGAEEDDGTLYVPKGNSQNDNITITFDDGLFPRSGSPKNGLNNRLRGTPLANRVTFPDKRGGGTF